MWYQQDKEWNKANRKRDKQWKKSKDGKGKNDNVGRDLEKKFEINSYTTVLVSKNDNNMMNNMKIKILTTEELKEYNKL